MTTLWVPSSYKPAEKKIAIVFYHQKSTGHIQVGFPDQYPLPKILEKEGFEKIVCRTAKEVELWDQKMREQEKREEEWTDEQREMIEGPIRRMARQELTHKMMHSRNAINREFCRQALLQLDLAEERMKMKRESFMHIVGFEDGK